VHWALNSELYEADRETFTDGVTTYERNALVLRNEAGSYGGDVPIAYAELSAYYTSNANSSRVICNAGPWSEMYSTTYGTARVIELDTHTVVLSPGARLWMSRGDLTNEWMRFAGTVGAMAPPATPSLAEAATNAIIACNVAVDQPIRR
jgi:hypothetical protein